MNDHHDQIYALRRDVDELKRVDAEIVNDIAQIKAALGQSATKADLATMETKISGDFHKTINGVLRDALNAVPAKQMVMWAAVSTLLAGLAFMAGHFHG